MKKRAFEKRNVRGGGATVLRRAGLWERTPGDKINHVTSVRVLVATDERDEGNEVPKGEGGEMRRYLTTPNGVTYQ